MSENEEWILDLLVNNAKGQPVQMKCKIAPYTLQTTGKYIEEGITNKFLIENYSHQEIGKGCYRYYFKVKKNSFSKKDF
jgi:hypothetical protein